MIHVMIRKAPVALLLFSVWSNYVVDCILADDSKASGNLDPAALVRSDIKAEARIRVRPDLLTTGDTLTIESDFYCKSGAGYVYNGFLSASYRLPAQIVITSSDEKIRQVLLRPSCKTKFHKSDAWVFLRSGESVGREFVFTIGSREVAQAGEFKTLELPPGEYSVQAIYSHWIVALNRNSIFPKTDNDHAEKEKEMDIPLPVPGYSPTKMDQPAAISNVATFRVR